MPGLRGGAPTANQNAAPPAIEFNVGQQASANTARYTNGIDKSGKTTTPAATTTTTTVATPAPPTTGEPKPVDEQGQ